jgi:hypothetical protein
MVAHQFARKYKGEYDGDTDDHGPHGAEVPGTPAVQTLVVQGTPLYGVSGADWLKARPPKGVVGNGEQRYACNRVPTGALPR